MKAIIIRFSIILWLCFLMELWLTRYSTFELQGNIPHTSIRISGLLILGMVLTVLILFQRRILKESPQTGILKLTLAGASICVIAEILMQLVRQFLINVNSLNDRFYYFGLGIATMIVCSAGYSFLVAFQLKTRKTGILILFCIAFLMIVSLLMRVFFGGGIK